MNRRQPSPGPARRRVAAVIGLAGLAGLVVSPLNAPPAHAASYLANAIYGLADARGWMSEDVTAEVDLLKVLAADPTGEIAVAVAPPEALLEIGAAEMAQELLWGTDWRSVVVAVGPDLAGRSYRLSSSLPEELAELAEKTEAASDDVEANLIELIRGLGRLIIEERNAPASPWPAAGETGAETGAWKALTRLEAISINLLALLAVIGSTWALIAWARRRRRRRLTGREVRISKLTPPDVAQRLRELRALRERYLGYNGPARASTAAMAGRIERIIADTSELFRRLDALGSGEQEAVARAEYGDQLAKVAKVLGEDYYLNILAYPELWEDPDGRAKAVKDAVAAFAKQIVQNIRQVNDAHDLRFQVPLEALDRIQRRPSAGLDPASPPAGRSTRAQRRRAREQDQGGRAR